MAKRVNRRRASQTFVRERGKLREIESEAPKIKVARVSYGRTINVGNYESVRIDLAADVPDGMPWKRVLRKLQNSLLRQERIIKGRTY